MARLAHILIALPVFVLCFGGKCDPAQEGDNLFSAREWTQLQGDEPGTGFNPVHTSATTPTSRKWSREIGGIAFSSPVISPLGEVWVGTSAGELFGLNKETGEILHRHDAAGGSIVSTPAVAEDGKVYFLSQHGDANNPVTSQLQVFDPSSNTLSAFQNLEVFQSTSFPKIWRDFVFVCELNDVIVFDKRTNEQTGVDPFAPRVWQQLHSDSENSGLNTVHTTPAFESNRRWSVFIGSTPLASPVVHPNGNIYIANTNVLANKDSELIGVSPSGQIALQREFATGEVFLTTPAVDRFGDIYLIASKSTSNDGLDG